MPLTTSNVVIAAQAFNPSIVTQLWLVKNRIAEEAEFEPNAVSIPGLSQIQTTRYTLLVIPEQLQLTPKLDVQNVGQMIAVTVGAFVEALPHTPFMAVGLNFSWAEMRDQEWVNAATRRLFFRQGILPYMEFDNPDARFGAYMSKDFENTRLKLHILPMALNKPDEPPQPGLQFSFNFTRDLYNEGEKVAAITQSLAVWDRAFRTAEDLVNRTMREVG